VTLTFYLCDRGGWLYNFLLHLAWTAHMNAHFVCQPVYNPGHLA
jgi:hypothetical protein